MSHQQQEQKQRAGSTALKIVRHPPEHLTHLVNEPKVITIRDSNARHLSSPAVPVPQRFLSATMSRSASNGSNDGPQQQKKQRTPPLLIRNVGVGSAAGVGGYSGADTMPPRKPAASSSDLATGAAGVHSLIVSKQHGQNHQLRRGSLSAIIKTGARQTSSPSEPIPLVFEGDHQETDLETIRQQLRDRLDIPNGEFDLREGASGSSGHNRTLVHSFSIGNHNQIKIYTQKEGTFEGNIQPTLEPSPEQRHSLPRKPLSKEASTNTTPEATEANTMPVSTPNQPPLASGKEEGSTKDSVSKTVEEFGPNDLLIPPKGLEHVRPQMKQTIIFLMHAKSPDQQIPHLTMMQSLLLEAWQATDLPNGAELINAICDDLRISGTLTILITNVVGDHDGARLESARVLERSLTGDNKEWLADRPRGLKTIVRCAHTAVQGQKELLEPTVGIIRHMFKHSTSTCRRLVQLGGLSPVVFACRSAHDGTLRNCAAALLNLAMLGGPEARVAMVKDKAVQWLFPLVVASEDPVARYFAALTVAVLAADVELSGTVKKSGSLRLIDGFLEEFGDVVSFAQCDSHVARGSSKDWLDVMGRLLDCSNCSAAQRIGAFHLALETYALKSQHQLKSDQTAAKLQTLKSTLQEIGVIDSMKRVVASTNHIAANFCKQTLEALSVSVPECLGDKVYLWSCAQVQKWLQTSQNLVENFGKTDSEKMEKSVKLPHTKKRIDGRLLLYLDDSTLRETLDYGSNKEIEWQLFRRQLVELKMTADYEGIDHTGIANMLENIDPDLRQYSYSLLAAGVTRQFMARITDDQLLRDCHITNGVHRAKILAAAASGLAKPVYTAQFSKATTSFEPLAGDSSAADKVFDVFISYRRATGSHLASLLKVHLQIRKWNVFLDVEKLLSGKFDEHLLESVAASRHFIVVLSESALDRCVGDEDRRDWVHKEIVTALETGANVVPVFADTFQWPSPDQLPVDMRRLCRFNGIKWIHDYQDACVDKIEKFFDDAAYASSSRQSNTRFSPMDEEPTPVGSEKRTNEALEATTSSVAHPPTRSPVAPAPTGQSSKFASHNNQQKPATFARSSQQHKQSFNFHNAP